MKLETKYDLGQEVYYVRNEYTVEKARLLQYILTAYLIIYRNTKLNITEMYFVKMMFS